MNLLALQVTRGASLFLVGLYAGGVLFTVLAPSLADLPGPAYVRYWQALNDDYGRTMPVLLLTAIVCTLVAAVLSRGRGGLVLGLSVLALLLLVSTVVLTLTQMEPLNRLADSWNPDHLPADWSETQKSWLSWHAVRTAVGMAAFASLLAAQTLDPIKR